MAFTDKSFTKSWNSSTDFPTYEDNETQVRADMQFLHDEACAMVNNLQTELESGTAAVNIGAKDKDNADSTVQAELGKSHTTAANLNAHIADTANPHSVTKAQVGLGNVDNTPDLSKPVSTATQAALGGKVDKVTGKGLSTNDYDATEKATVAANASARHSHSNKALLDSYTQTNADIADAISKEHTHGNIAALNSVPSGGVVTSVGVDNTTVPTSKAVKDYTAENAQGKIMVSGLLKGNGSGGIAAAVAGTDYDTEIVHVTSSDSASVIYGYMMSGKTVLYTGYSTHGTQDYRCVYAEKNGDVYTAMFDCNAPSFGYQFNVLRVYRIKVTNSTWGFPVALNYGGAAEEAQLSEHTGNSTIHVTSSDKAAWSGKQDALPAVVNDRYLHTNASTGALEWATGSGGGGGTDANAVHYTADTNKSAAEKAQARANIGAGTSDFSGAYADLTGKPSIPSTLASLTDDSTHRLVTDADKTAWNAKATKPDLGTISISTAWTGSASPYTQTVTVTGANITANSKVDIQPSAALIAQMVSDECTALYIENNAGTLTLYAVGAGITVAQSDVQVTVTEVT